MATALTKAQLSEALYASEQSVSLLEERFAELELSIEDAGWLRLSTQSNREFTRDGLRKIILSATMSFLKNPLIRHATEVQSHYVWGQGVTVHCPDPGINKVIQTFLLDRKNRKVLTGHQARIEREQELQTKANLFITFFSNAVSGRVQVRTISVDEVQDIIRNPDDSAEPWYYVRQYTRLEFNPENGKTEEKKGVVEYYPDWLYEPDLRPAKFGDAKVRWDSPVYHVAVGKLGDMRFGVPEHYAALDWAAAVKNDLEDYATIRRALARFAFKLTASVGPKAVSNAKTRLGTTLGNAGNGAIDRNPPPVAGSTWIQQMGGANLEPFKTAGAQPNPEEGRRLWLMVSSGTGIPETILTGDSSVGNYATSRTLDRPTELKMRTRQELWADVYKDILTYVVSKSKSSTNGPISSLPSTVESALREAAAIVAGGGSALVDLGKGAGADAAGTLEAEDFEINVDFPAILEHDMLPRVQAIVQAATLNGQKTAGTMSDRTLIRLLLQTLNVANGDALLDEILPDGAEYFDTEDATPQIGPDGKTVPTDGQPTVGDHKVADPPPSMRNNAPPPAPFGGPGGAFGGEPGPTGAFKSDKNSQRMRGSTPPRGK